MTPEMLLANATALLQTLMTPGGALAALVGTAAYGYGKAADSPNATRWGKNAWLGAIILWAGTAVIGLVHYLSEQLFH